MTKQVKRLKIKEPILNKMRAAMKAVVEQLGGVEGWNSSRLQRRNIGHTDTRILWDTWHRASNNLMYDDKHPMFAPGRIVRCIPHDPEFNMNALYAPGVNDSHIESAIFAIAEELGLDVTRSSGKSGS
jgi:hypothetical protein